MLQVVVGTYESIAAVEEMLKPSPRLDKIQHQRLRFSHGFHSRFTKAIIEGLRTVAKIMTFNLPMLPIETSTLQQVEVFTPNHIPRHTRNSVYFYHAVRRTEQRLGPCTWLEAGINSPIIPLVKRAVESPAQHVFEVLRLKSPSKPVSAVYSITLNLWREGSLQRSGISKTLNKLVLIRSGFLHINSKRHHTGCRIEVLLLRH